MSCCAKKFLGRAAALERGARRGLKGGPILVVEDHPASRSFVEILLKGQGYEVHAVADAEAALLALEHVRPRLILLDVGLPGIGGLELARRLRADPRLGDVVILAMTARATLQDEQASIDAGCDGHLAKPFRSQALLDAIRSRLG